MNFRLGMFIAVLFMSCTDCEESVFITNSEIIGNLKIDSLYERYGDRAMTAMSNKTKMTIKIFDYHSFPILPQVGDSIVKFYGEITYTLYRGDSFYVMGMNCNKRQVVVYSRGSVIGR
ncbi:hypothetical protein [Sphingobacterium humi]|uniref:Uncharacterized protein n=1 Tax=Sphingobacterium humi TaxID=1796905 RepID=A0A6N8L3B8_9SPHI|nr:hypothetical protein [Sphingobacterium humi]MVZ63777.1 hypothetical protein [Sphingobacterium humi]